MALGAGWETWNHSGLDPTRTLANLYDERWALYTGQLFSDWARRAGIKPGSRLYANTRLISKHVNAVVTFYQTTVYQGDLSTDGKPLPDGTRGAIPLDPQTGGDATDDQLRQGIAELWSAWNWKQQMTLRPMYAAALGDVLTELVDDVERGIVYPAHVWPAHVTAIELDYVGNVKAYTLEYRVTEDHGNGNQETYTYRKDVDKDAFRYFKNDKPFDYYGEGSVVKNPYGFVPAIWDRHSIGRPGSERGHSATDDTRQALYELNSLGSHAIDFQRKAFFAPILVKGTMSKPGQTAIQLRKPPVTQDDASALAESLGYLQASDQADIVQAVFDVGQTDTFLERIKQGILDENPEASFYQQLRQMSQVTAPGAERLLGDAVNRCRTVRAGADAQTVKLLQMALAMSGYRANGNGWRTPLSKRQKVWQPYSLDSYRAGTLDFSISDRPVIPPTEAERVQLVLLKEQISTVSSLEDLGYDPEEARRRIDERQAAQFGADTALTGIGAGGA